MQCTTFLSFSSVRFRISFEDAVQLPFTVLLYSTFPDNYAFLSLLPSQIKNTQSADRVPVHGHSPLVLTPGCFTGFYSTAFKACPGCISETIRYRKLKISSNIGWGCEGV